MVRSRVRLVWPARHSLLACLSPGSQTAAKFHVECPACQGNVSIVSTASSELRSCLRSHRKGWTSNSGSFEFHSVFWRSMSSDSSSKDADASKVDDAETNQKGQWRKWIEARLDAKEKKETIRSSTQSPGEGSSIESHPSLEGDFEPNMLEGKVQINYEGDHNGEKGLLGDLEQINKSSRRRTRVTSSLAREDKENVVESDDFLQELEKIEKSARKAERFRNDTLEDVGVLHEGRNGNIENGSIEVSADLGDYDLTKGTESDLDDDEAIFYRDGIGFVTNKGVLEIPGLGDLETQDLDKPYHFRPDRLYYPGQTYVPEDLDISRPTEEQDEVISRPKKIHSSGEVWERSDFRNVRFLTQFITETSRLHPRRKNMVSAKAQRKIVREIKIARAFGLVPFTSMGEPPYSFLKSRKVQDFDSDDEDGDEDDDYDQDHGGENSAKALI